MGGAKSQAMSSVFLVDDHPVVRDGMAQLIDDEQDLNVCGAAAGLAEATKKMAKSRPDIAVVDMNPAKQEKFLPATGIQVQAPEKVLPHLDDVTMAKLALGKNWKKATREQKIEFVGEFRNLLVRTYSKSLLEFSDQEIFFFPVKLAADTHKASVKAEVVQSGGPSIPMSYRVRIKNNAWKVYDIKIDGISLVTSYRGTFSQEIRKSGMDGLLKYMRDKNSKLASKVNQNAKS